MTDLEKMRAGRWLHAVTPEISAALRATEELCFRFNRLPPSHREEREAILREMFGHVGEGICLHSPFHCDFGKQISIGDHFVGNFHLTILDEAPVTIGNHVYIGPNVGIYTVSHALHADQRNEGIMRSLPKTSLPCAETASSKPAAAVRAVYITVIGRRNTRAGSLPTCSFTALPWAPSLW